jgi:signal transduction histidine kinase
MPIPSFEQAFRVQNAILTAQAETTIDGILVVSPERKILMANRRFRELWRIPPDVILDGDDAAALEAAIEQIADPHAFLARVQYLYEHPREIARDEIPLKDGRIFDRYTAPLLGKRNAHYGRIWYFRDLTPPKHHAAIEQERRSLREAAARMDEVLGILGHELRTPLASLRAITELLLDCRSRNTPEFDEFLAAIGGETARMNDIVDNLLEAARLNSGRARWNWGTVSLQDVCSEAVEVIRPQLDGAAVALACTVNPPSAEMAGDPGAIRRLLINLLANAGKHTDRGRIDLSARFRPDPAGTFWVELSVSDTGDGMKPAILERLGHAFALNSGVIGDRHVKGSGLGLFICRGIAAAHGGVIHVDSKYGVGTIMTTRLRADLPGPVETQPAELKIACRAQGAA